MLSSEKTSRPRLRWLVSDPVTLTKKQSRLLNFFFVSTLVGTFLTMVGIILYYVYAYASLSGGSHAFDWLLGIFSDFVAILDFSLGDSPYVVDGSSYPPLAIVILYPFALICKNAFTPYMGQNMDIDLLTSKVILYPQFWVALVLFFLLCSGTIIFILIKKYRFGARDSLKLSIAVLLSAPFIYAIMRGNTIYFALIFLLIFLLLYDHKNPVVRELAYLSLVVAGLIKIYPLFFGVFLLHKKKIFASARIAVYYVVFFFLSFFLFKAGIDDFSIFIDRLGGFMSDDLRLLSGVNLSITSLLYKFFFPLAPDFADGIGFSVLNMIILILIFLAAAVCATITKSDFSRYMIASAIVVLIPPISYFYILIFEILPFLQLIRDYETLPQHRRKIYTALFWFLSITLFIVAKNFIFHTMVVMTMLFSEMVNVTRNEIIPYLRRKKLTADNRAVKTTK